jgi:hypothetical protein
MKLSNDIVTDISNPDKLKFCSNPVSPIIKLAATLRYLGGGIYHDICWCFEIHETSFHRHVTKTMEAINRRLNNSSFP